MIAQSKGFVNDFFKKNVRIYVFTHFTVSSMIKVFRSDSPMTSHAAHVKARGGVCFYIYRKIVMICESLVNQFIIIITKHIFIVIFNFP